jgi:hypothetical protein
VGTPVSFDEDGKSLCADFAKLLDIPEMSAEHYMRGFDVECTLPSFRPQILEVCRQLSNDLPSKLVSCEGEIHGVKSKKNNAVFLTDLDPQQRLVDQIEDKLSKTVKVHGENILWRLYRDESGLSLMVVSVDERTLNGVVLWGKSIIEIDGGSAGLLTITESGTICMDGDLSWRFLNGESRHA